MSGIIYEQGRSVNLTLTAGQSLAVYTRGKAQVFQLGNYPNFPAQQALLATVQGGQTVFGPYANGAVLAVENIGADRVEYSQGLAPIAKPQLQFKPQATPGVLNATGTLTAALIQAGIVTSTTAAAVVATLDTGTVLDAAADLAVGDSFDWSAIATGANAFTVTASAGHTIVGAGAVATLTSGHFRTLKTAAATFVTYRVG